MGKINNKTLASVQQHFVAAREVLGDVLCLSSASSPTGRVYRAIIEIAPINFLLKSEEEQEALIARFRHLLKALSFPIQIVIRNERLDLRPYLARLEAQTRKRQPDGDAAGGGATIALEGTRTEEAGWPTLARAVATLLQTLASRRTLIERRWYMVVPAPSLPPRAAVRFRVQRPRTRKAEQAAQLAQVFQELAIRAQMLQQHLSALGVRARRLAGVELAACYYRCLTPERALYHPLLREHLAAVGRVPLITRRRRGAPQFPTVPAPPVPGIDLRQEQEAGIPPFDLLRLADVLAPGFIEEFRDGLCIGGEWVRGLAITAFPREVAMGAWLAPLWLQDELLDIVWHLHPQPSSQVLRALKRRRTGYAATRAFNQRQGRSADPEMEVASRDVSRLMSQIASGEERVFEVSFLVLVRAAEKAGLDERTERVMALLHAILLDAVAHPTTFEHARAFRSFLPQGRDEVRRTIALDATSVASTFPFVSNALMMPGGTFLGLSGSGEPVFLDPWHTSLENPHTFVGGVTGAGKSYLGKLWLERSMLTNGHDERHWVIDPDGEFAALVEALGGERVALSPSSSCHLNPFDLLPPGCELHGYLSEVGTTDRLAEKILDLHSLLDVLLAEAGATLSTREKALLDRCLYETYRRRSISADPRTHFHQPPLLRDLAAVLRSGVCGPDEFDLGLRLSRYTEGSLSGLFADHTNVPLDGPLLSWDVSEMRGDLRPLGIFLIAEHIWTQAVYQSRIRRCLTIDEAASLIEHPEGGRFLANLSRRARKRYLRLVTMTQTPEVFVENEWGAVVAANAAIKMLKKQDRTSVRAVTRCFGLSAGEARRLLSADVSEALVLCGDRRVVLSVQASAQEHALITTNPVELAARAPAPGGQQSQGQAMDQTPTAPLSPVSLSHTEDEPTIRRARVPKEGEVS